MPSEVFLALDLLQWRGLLKVCSVAVWLSSLPSVHVGWLTLNLGHELPHSLEVCFHIHYLYSIVCQLLVHALQARFLAQVINLKNLTILTWIGSSSMLRPGLNRCNSWNNWRPLWKVNCSCSNRTRPMLLRSWSGISHHRPLLDLCCR